MVLVQLLPGNEQDKGNENHCLVMNYAEHNENHHVMNSTEHNENHHIMNSAERNEDHVMN